MIRRARPADRDAVFEMSRTIWGGGDYLPLVWDRWLADRQGAFLVALHEDRPIGTSKVTLLGPGEVWLEGLRLHRDYHGRGLSRQIHTATFREAKRLNPRSVRYSTWIGNEASRHIAETHGFWQIACTSWMSARTRRGKLRSRRASRADLDDVVRFVHSSGSFRATGGVMGVGWKFPGLTRRRIAALVKRGNALVMRRGGAIRAAALFDIEEVDGELCLGFVDGSDREVSALARDVLAVAKETGRKEASAMLPEGRIADLVFRSGFSAAPVYHAVVYELGARGVRGTEGFESLATRTLTANESAVADLVAEFLMERMPRGVLRENVRDFLRRRALPDTRRVLAASLLGLYDALGTEEARAVLHAVALHFHDAHGLAGDSMEFGPRTMRVRHLGRTLAVVRCSTRSLSLTLGPGFGPCFPPGLSLSAKSVRFPKRSLDAASGRYASLMLVLSNRGHVAGATRAIDMIMASARRRPPRA